MVLRPKKVDFDQVRSLYEGRTSGESDAEPIEDLGISDSRSDLTERLCSAIRDVASDGRGVIENIAPGTDMAYYLREIDPDRNLYLIGARWIMDDPDYHQVHFTFVREPFLDDRESTYILQLAWDDKIPTSLSNFLVQGYSSEVSLDHRFTPPKYRRQGVGSMMLKAIESYLQEVANQRGAMEFSILTGRLDVICWLNNLGYQVADEDMGKFLAIVNGDDRLCLGERNCVFTVNVPEEERTFENMDLGYGVRVKFVKKINPSTEELDVVSEDVAARVGGLSA